MKKLHNNKMERKSKQSTTQLLMGKNSTESSMNQQHISKFFTRRRANNKQKQI